MGAMGTVAGQRVSTKQRWTKKPAPKSDLDRSAPAAGTTTQHAVSIVWTAPQTTPPGYG